MIAEVLRWWLAVEAMGLIALPIVFVVFQRLPGRGIAFAKPAGMLLIGYLFWLALTLHVLPNRPGSIVWVMLPLIVASVLIARSRWQEMREYAEEHAGYILAVEVVFFFGLFIAAHIKSFLPEVAGTEKPMDFMFLNAAGRSEFYPPRDPWLSGAGVSYYYFGYVINAMTGKLAALPAAVTFNVALASTAALAATAAFGLGYEISRLVRRMSAAAAMSVGAGAILLLVVVGNLESVFEWGIANDVLSPSVNETVQINDLETARPSNDCFVPFPGGCLVNYPSDNSSFWWWWRSTRISPDGNSITEFPFFSFILGDLHPHVMAIPFVLTVFALGLSFWATNARLDLDVWRRSPMLLLVSALLLGGLGFLNTWDLPTFGFLLAALVLARNYLASRASVTLAPAIATPVAAQERGPAADLWANTPARDDDAPPPPPIREAWAQAELTPLRPAIPTWLTDTAGFVGPLILLAALLYAPFYVSFSSQASGFEAVVNGATRPLHSALFWGVLAAVNLPLPFVLLTRDGFKRRPGDLLLALSVPAALLVLWVLVMIASDAPGVGDAIAARGWNWFTYLFFATAFAGVLLALRRLLNPETPQAPPMPGVSTHDIANAPSPEATSAVDDSPALVPVLIAMATGLLLILGAELFYVQDVFSSRLNTVFKLSYQAWLLLAISGAYSLWWLANHPWRLAEASPEDPPAAGAADMLRGAWNAVALMVIAAGLLYPIGATLARTSGLSEPGRTLDGLDATRRSQPDDFAAIAWIRDRAGQDERIVEGTGGQYSASGRVAAFTGVPTVIGWHGHEVQWGRDGNMLGRRQEDVDRIYTTESMEEALRILQQYEVTYVFVGSVERAKYPPAGLAKFVAGLPVAARFGETVIYRVPRAAPENSNAYAR